MKRKRNNEPSVMNKKRKSSGNLTLTNFSEKTLLDFWGPKQSKKETKKKGKSKSRSDSKDSQRSLGSNHSTQSKTVQLVKNPSKQILKAPIVSESLVDYKHKILFNEEFVRKLKLLLEPFLNQAKNCLVKISPSLLEEETCDKFITSNLDSILTKFLLQINDDFLFVPISYMNKNESTVDKSKLKLLEGFNDLKYISLQYYPIKAKEILNDDFANSLTAYLRHFNKRKKKNGSGKDNGGNKNRKAFVVQNANYIDLIKTIEVICGDQDYKIIRLDELENQKMNKLNRISEATQSQRLSCLPEALNEKLKILERIISNNHQKFNSLFNNHIDLSDSQQSSMTPTTSTTASETITHYFTQDTKERSIYNTIQDNVYRICAKKKTLILIVDSFKNEDDKTYLNGIINKISLTKCPIIILTNNLDFAKSDNLFNNSAKTITNHFLFYQVDSNSKLSQQKTTYLVTLILFLHTVLKDHMESILKMYHNESGNEIANEVTFVLYEKLYGLFNEEMLDNLVNGGIMSEIAELSLKICLTLEYDLDRIFNFIFNALRFGTRCSFGNHGSIEEKLHIIERCLNDSSDDSETITVNINAYNELDELKHRINESEKIYFDDLIECKAKKFASKKFDYFYYDVNRKNNKIMKDETISKKDPLIHKNIDQLANCESVIFNTFMYKDTQDNNLIPGLSFYKKDFHQKFCQISKELLEEDKIFYSSLLGNKISSVSKKNLHELNFLFQDINGLDYENFLALFGIRKPRSTRKLVKEKDANALNEETKTNALSRVFKGISNNLFEKFQQFHNFDEILCRIGEKTFCKQFNTKYFTGNRIYEEIRGSELSNMLDYSSAGEDCTYISEEEEDEFE